MPSLSIIIPIFNVEPYIAKCLDSAINQDIDDYEIICVNDESQDKSREIVVKYQKLNSNIKLIDRKNGGLSAARNSGIRVANGKYLLFLDSDDYLSENVLGHMFNHMESESLHILVGNIQWVDDNGIIKQEKQIKTLLNDTKLGEVLFNELIENNYYVPMAYNLMCRRDFIVDNKLFFREGFVYEDEMWTPEVLLKAEKVNGTHLYHYNYYQRHNTITSSTPNLYKLSCLVESSKHLLKLSEKFNNKSNNTKANLWSRAYVIYSEARKHYANNKALLPIKDFSIIKLLKERFPENQFEKCLQNTIDNKTMRRFYRIIYSLLKIF